MIIYIHDLNCSKDAKKTFVHIEKDIFTQQKKLKKEEEYIDARPITELKATNLAWLITTTVVWWVLKYPRPIFFSYVYLQTIWLVQTTKQHTRWTLHV